MSLVELLTVVAIVGVMSSLSVVSFRDFAMTGRVNRGAKVLATALASARLRAVSTGCMHFVQVNGRQFNGTVAGAAAFPNRPMDRNVLFLVRKAEGRCNGPNGFFEDGDRIVERFTLGPEEAPDSVRLFSPTNAWGTPILDGQSLALSYNRFGVRTASFHPGGGAGYGAVAGVFDGVVVQEGLPSAVLVTQRTRTIDIPAAGSAKVKP
jgi:type II secretory pathway pseudopilin PulG